MGKILIKNKIILFEFLTLSLLFFILFKDIIFEGTLLHYDDMQLILPLKTISSVYDFFFFYLKKQYIDIQPIRDLSFLLDLKLNSLFPWYSFKMTNFILWSLILINTQVFFSYFISDRKLLYLAVLLIGTSPISISSIAWTSARKHILSMFFISCGNVLLLKKSTEQENKKNELLVIFLYFLSLLSHPISLFYPLFVVVLKRQFQLKLSKKIWFFFSIIFGIVFLLNFTYYQNDFLSLTGGIGKFSKEQDQLSLPFLALGRYFFLSINPFDFLPTSHSAESIKNLLGLTLLLSALGLSFFTRSKIKFLFLAWSYFFIFLAPVTFKMTNIFCSDTYLLHAQLGIYLLFLLFINFFSRFKKIILILISILFLFLLPITADYSKKFKDDFNLLSFSFKKEPTYFAAAGLVRYYILNKNFALAEKYFNGLITLNSQYRFNNFLRGLIIFENNQLQIPTKIQKINEFKIKTGSTYYFLARLYFLSNNKEKYHSSLRELLLHQDSLKYEIPSDANRIIALSKNELIK